MAFPALTANDARCSPANNESIEVPVTPDWDTAFPKMKIIENLPIRRRPSTFENQKLFGLSRRICYLASAFLLVAVAISLIVAFSNKGATDLSTPQSGIPTHSPVSAFPLIPETIVLHPNRFLERGEFAYSPSRAYQVGLTNTGDLVLLDIKSSRTLWSAGTAGGHRCHIQGDGNVVVRASDNQALWTSHTYKNPGARLVVDDGGRIAIMHGNTPLWLNGIPRGIYNGPSSRDLEFPVRGVFYYPWYPETWTVNGHVAKFEPDLGFYSSSDSRVAEAHIDAFEYAHVDLSIASWWGPESNLDRARLTMLMERTIALGSNVKWTVYHEDERELKPSSKKIKEDLDYLKKWFAWQPAWAHVDGRPLIFVYNGGGCEVVDRWMAASNGEWYVVLKIFSGYKDCPTQPDHWVSYDIMPSL
jgi:hypothetical protein